MAGIRTHYLDTSAIVKLLVDEEGTVIVRDYFNRYTNFYTTSWCFVETLGALKTKYLRRHISQKKYFDACDELMAHISGESIGIDEIEIANRETYSEVESLAQKYDLDISDAFQIVTLKRGFLSRLTGESQPMLITGDSGLAVAVRQEGLKVWDLLEEPEP